MKVKKGRPLRILETHQGKGDATSEYRLYGCVISFEIDREAYETICKRFPEAYSLEACLESGRDLLDMIRDHETDTGYPVIVPSRPIDSHMGLAILSKHGYRFDVIDVDPFGSPRDFIPDVLHLLDNDSFLFVTSGEMHCVRFRPHDAMSPYGIQADDSLKVVRTFFRQDNILVIGSWIIEAGLKKSVALYPIFIYDYYNGYSGVQRLGYYVKRQASLAHKIEMAQQIRYDPILRVKSVKCSFSDGRPDVPWRFSDASSETKIREFIMKRINLVSRMAKT
jgi:hypothetical protein